MKCAGVKKHLSEYLDNVLDAGTISTIQGHLGDCEACREEYVALKEMIHDLNSMDTIEAPGDLLERVHERLEADSIFGKIRHLLFSPARIKIPMELTALTATALIVFMLFFAVEPETGVDKTIPGTGDDRVAFTSEKDSGFTPMGEGPIQLELILGPGDRTRPLPPENVITVLSDDLHERREETEFGPGSRLPGLRPGLDRFFDDVNRPLGDNIDSQGLDDVVIGLNEIISLMNGRLLTTGYRTGTDRPEYITLEIPGDNYPLFLEKIGRMGSLKSPAPDLPSEFKDMVPLQIRLIPTE